MIANCGAHFLGKLEDGRLDIRITNLNRFLSMSNTYLLLGEVKDPSRAGRSRV